MDTSHPPVFCDLGSHICIALRSLQLGIWSKAFLRSIWSFAHDTDGSCESGERKFDAAFGHTHATGLFLGLVVRRVGCWLDRLGIPWNSVDISIHKLISKCKQIAFPRENHEASWERSLRCSANLQSAGLPNHERKYHQRSFERFQFYEELNQPWKVHRVAIRCKSPFSSKYRADFPPTTSVSSYTP